MSVKTIFLAARKLGNEKNGWHLVGPLAAYQYSIEYNKWMQH